MDRLKQLVKGLAKTVKQLRVEGNFQKKFLNIVELAKSPFVQLMLANFNVDPKILDTIFDALLHDKMVLDITDTVANIFDCFSVDRFVGVETEKELEDLAIELNQKKLFFAGIYFNNHGYGNHSEYSYKLRMDVDNTPVTLENRNRFWFPGPNGNFELNMRYHRGFIQLQHMIDQAITKTIVDAENDRQEQEWRLTTTTTTTTPEPPTTTDNILIDIDDRENGSTDESQTTEIEEQSNQSENDSKDEINATESSNPVAESAIDTTSIENKDASEGLDKTSNNDGTTADLTPKVRRKRQIDFGDLFGGDSSTSSEQKFHGIDVNNYEVYTKQFPYPKYNRDDFVTGLYLAQCIQLAFFFALIIQVSNAVRNRIWTSESGNSTVRIISF